MRLPGSAEFKATLIDDKAVLTDQDRKYVYIVDKDGKAQRRDITPGRLADGLRIVQKGLNPGDSVIVDGLQKVFMPGMPVNAKTVAMTSALPLTDPNQRIQDMDFSRFFIDRPIFAAVLSILIFITGLIAIPLLPVSEYPDVVPPSVQVRAEYPGANPKVIAETVATPLEEAINGVENMMYMKSVAGSDGVLVTTVTFRPGTDPDQAQVQVQNRVAQAEARLPEDVRRLGITTQKQSPTLTLVVHLFSPNGKYDSLYMRNYATLKVKDELARLPGVGQIQIFGSGEYAMRVWLDPNKVAARGLTASDVVTAMQEQNVQVSAGQLGAEPLPQESDFLISINAQGRLHTEEEFGNIILKTAQDGSLVRLRDVARIEMGSDSYALRSQLNNKDAVGIGIFQSPALTPSICRTRYAPKWPSWPPASRKICNGQRRTTRRFSCATPSARWCRRCWRR